MHDITLRDERNDITLSPRAGGRIVSWRHTGSDAAPRELVKEPNLLEGGLLRVLLAEERYPGASYVTPHLLLNHRQDANGFAAHLRYFWSTPNAMARLLGWHDKANPCYLDSLLLDKRVAFDADASALSVELTITNLAGERRRVTPWLHNFFAGWVGGGFVVRDGQAEPYRWDDIFWAGRRPDGATSMRLVLHDQASERFAVLGADPAWLDGMAMYIAPGWPVPEAGCIELRGRAVTLEPGSTWRASAFLAVTAGSESWRRWATTSPPLPSELTRRRLTEEPAFDPASLAPLLAEWARPEEVQRGAMVVSYLDAVPFAAADREGAAHSLAGFHPTSEGRAEASVVVVPLGEGGGARLRARLDAPAGWTLAEQAAPPASEMSWSVEAGRSVRVTVAAPADLADAGEVRVLLTLNDRDLAEVRVEPDASVSPVQPYQVLQVTTYLEQRWKQEKGGFNGATAGAYRKWQRATRRRVLAYLETQAAGRCDLAPRLMERQVGPACVRDKVLLQVEPEMWMPTSVIYPKDPARRPAKMPAVIFIPGSGPGRYHMAGPERAEYQTTTGGDEFATLAYRLAGRLGCLVMVTDRRGWGEWSEGNHNQRPQRAWNAGYNMVALEVRDHLRAVDYLRSRPDTHERGVISMGSSGGGMMTRWLLGLHEGVAGGVVSSAETHVSQAPPGFFYQLGDDGAGSLHPSPREPLSSADTVALGAPRPVWLMDGDYDRGYIGADVGTVENADAVMAAANARQQAGRDYIRRAYEVAGAAGAFRADWFPGDHLAGFTYENIAGWMLENWGIAPL